MVLIMKVLWLSRSNWQHNGIRTVAAGKRGSYMEFTQEELTAIKSDLTSSKSAKRRSAAKKIGKQQITSLKDDLLEA